ncbi:NTP transferase domain-containing protein, partial [Candidatus Aerophobetes bacterium]|nr:NTP transferase domain-containing protein [Candidatus Aerophobetes bacterium]
MKKRIIAIVIARMSSTRLPGKVLIDICGRPMLGHIVDRLRRVKSIDEIVLATTNKNEDKPLIEFAKREKIKSFAYKGDPEDVVNRIRKTAERFYADIIVNVNGDCPLINPSTIENLIQALIMHNAERALTSQVNGRRHEGVDIFTLRAWQKVDENSTKSYQRQNTTGCLHERPDILRTVEIEDEPIFYELNHRIWVDTPADLNFIREIYKRLYKPGEIVDLRKVIRLLQKEPELMEINSYVRQKKLQDKSKKIVFRADASREVGMGHIMRCLALAQQLQEYHFCGVNFVTKSSNGVVDMIRERGFGVKVLPQGISKNDELNEVVNFSQDYGADRIILDLKGNI